MVNFGVQGTIKKFMEIDETIENTESEWKDTYQELPIKEMPVLEINGHYYVGTLDIPKLNLSLPIMSESSVNNLLISPCRYYGSAYTNDMVIAAHNYRSHFARLNQLNEHDEIIFTDMDGNVFEYEYTNLFQKCILWVFASFENVLDIILFSILIHIEIYLFIFPISFIFLSKYSSSKSI